VSAIPDTVSPRPTTSIATCRLDVVARGISLFGAEPASPDTVVPGRGDVDEAVRLGHVAPSL
jgi:hypothetical protein